MSNIIIPRGEGSMTIGRDGLLVLIKIDNKVHAIPWRQADEICNAIRARARQAEELEKAESVAFDNAILMRKGIPLGLSDDPKIKEHTGWLAAWNKKLRKYLPGGIKSEEQFGAPSIINHSPPKR